MEITTHAHSSHHGCPSVPFHTGVDSVHTRVDKCRKHSSAPTACRDRTAASARSHWPRRWPSWPRGGSARRPADGSTASRGRREKERVREHLPEWLEGVEAVLEHREQLHPPIRRPQVKVCPPDHRQDDLRHGCTWTGGDSVKGGRRVPEPSHQVPSQGSWPSRGSRWWEP